MAPGEISDCNVLLFHYLFGLGFFDSLAVYQLVLFPQWTELS